MGIARQFQALWPTILWTYLPTLAVLAGVAGYALATDRRIWYFTNDPFTLGHLPFYAGVLSSLMNVLWGAGATVCFFCALVLRSEERGAKTEYGRQRTENGEAQFPYPLHPTPDTLQKDGRWKMEENTRGEATLSRSRDLRLTNAGREEGGTSSPPYPLFYFLLASGLLTALLLFDDLFQFHRIFYIKYFQVSAKMVFAGYGVLALGYLLHFRKTIAETEYLLLGLALAFLGAAVVFDTVALLPRGRTAFSDFLKFFGIVTWVAYFVRTGRWALRG